MAAIIFLSVILLSLEADAESAVDYGKSCSSCTLGEVANLIREEFRDVKNLIATNQMSAVEASKQTLAAALVREYIIIIIIYLFIEFNNPHKTVS